MSLIAEVNGPGRRRHRVVHDGRALFAGNLVALAGTKRRKLVLIQSVLMDIDHSAVSSALDQHSYFSVSGGWHAARVHHHCRLLDPPEQPCEHVGSLLHAGWNPSQHLAPRPLIDAALLKQARVSCIVGSVRDDVIVHTVCGILRQAGMTAWSNRGHAPLQQLQNMRVAAQQDGRCFDGLFGQGSLEAILAAAIPDEFSAGCERQQLRASRSNALAKSLPVNLPRALEETVVGETRKRVIAPPPLAVPLSSKRLRKAATSTQRAALADWLSTEEGLRWRQEREAIFSS